MLHTYLLAYSTVSPPPALAVFLWPKFGRKFEQAGVGKSACRYGCVCGCVCVCVCVGAGVGVRGCVCVGLIGRCDRG
jgi:hypothetical protein